MFLGVRNCTQTAYTPTANLPTVGLCYGYGLMPSQSYRKNLHPLALPALILRGLDLHPQ